MQISPRTLREADAARYIGCSVSFLRASRLKKARTDGPAFIRIGKAIRYTIPDLDAFIDAKRQGAMR